MNAKSHRLYTNALKSLKRKEDLINLKVLDTNIGMGVYEGYLIERMKPTVSFEDKQFKAYLKECIDLLIFWRDYFRSFKFTWYNSHSAITLWPISFL